ncbi:hypothetical protein L9F63_003000, partial [Diploptera punctata]
MGESTNSLDDSSPKTGKEIETKERPTRNSAKKENKVNNALPKTFTPKLKRKQIDSNTESPLTECDDKKNSDLSDISPVTKSRYGRTHKPKIPEDFLPTDKKVAAILGHSPHKSPGKNLNSPVISLSDVTKVTVKGRKLYDIFTKKDKCSNGISNLADNQEVKEKQMAEASDKIKTENSGKRTETVEVNGTVTQINVEHEECNESSLQKNENIPACDWVVGDLAWARVSGYPFWPCMIALDPEKGIFTKIITRGNISFLNLHVQFFGDHGRRSWLFSNCVIPFSGLKALNELSTKIQSEVKKRDKKLTSAFHVTPKAKVKWDIAVEEAEIALRKTREERIEYFAIHFPYESPKKNKKGENTISSPTGKQNQLKKDDGVTQKIFKGNMISLEITAHNMKSPVVSNDVLSDGDSSPRSKAASPQSAKKKYQRKRYNANNQNMRGDFKVYLKKYIDRVWEEHPELSKKAVEKYLAKEWLELDDQQKSKYNVHNSEDDNDSGEEEGEEEAEEEEVDTESNDSGKASSTETRETSPAPHSKMRKGGGLFRGTKQEKVCQICEKPGDTVKCKGLCGGSFHVNCVSKMAESETEENNETLIEQDESTDNHKKIKNSDEDEESGKDKIEDEEKFRCWDCRRGQNPPCFACDWGENQHEHCSISHCGRFYHPECLKLWPHACSNNGSSSRRQAAAAAARGGNGITTITCPQHVCHTCASDDPRNATTRYNHERLVRCIRCPTAYHTGNYCLPAGSEVLTGSQIICPKHYKPPTKKTHHVNAAWCFICAMGGSLICCDLCPTSFHAECLNISPPEGSFICEDCDTGRFPLYGEIVWVKL